MADQKKYSNQPKKPKKPWVEKDEYGEFLPLDEEQTLALVNRGFNLCAWYLGNSAKTRHELTVIMEKKELPENVIEAVFVKLDEYNYVNDEAYTENFVRAKHEGSQKKSSSAIRYELIRKGVDQETIDVALESITEESEYENAKELVQKKLASTQRLDPKKRTNRLVGMLARKGYSPGIAYAIVKEALNSEDEEDY